MKKWIILGSTLLVLFLTFCQSKDIEIQYYPSGQVKYKAEVSNGKYNGLMLKYYEDGTLKNKSEWKDGLLNGNTFNYFSNGQLKSQSVWKNGKANGLSEAFFENGKKAYQGLYKEGLNIDTVFFYYESGRVKEKDVFDVRGVRIDAYRFDEQGNKSLEHTQPLIYSVKDTLSVDEILKIEIRLANRLSDSLQVLIGPLNRNLELTDTLKTLNGHLAFYHSFKPTNIGKDSITGRIDHYIIHGDTTQINHYPFSYSFYVEPALNK